MTERTLSDVEVSAAIRKPSFEMQQAAIVAGYASVRDLILAECVEEIRALKDRIEILEAEDFRKNLDQAIEYGREDSDA